MGLGKYPPTISGYNRIQIQNRALGGTSSRSFINRGLWAEVLKQAKKGDYLLIQFGHNEGGPLDDTARARGTLKGVGAESKEIYNPIFQKHERVHTYGWYLHKMIQEAKQKGVQVVLCSLIPRNRWQADQVERASGSYATWAAQIAQQNKVTFIDLNSLIADEYEKIGKDSVANFFTSADHTHTSYSGAEKNAQILCDAIRNTRKIKLRKYLIP